MFETMLIQKILSAALCAATLLGLPACSTIHPSEISTPSSSETAAAPLPPDAITVGTETQRGFVNDNVYHSELGDIHYSSYIPDSYDGTEPYALFITLPGWEGLHFQGVGANMVEDFGTEALKYNDKMIVLSTQLDDWGETSANHTIALTEYFLEHYNIDPSKVYLHGMSGGGETASLVMGKRPELYTACLMTSSQWDGDLNVLAQSRTPVYMAIGNEDSYYGSESLKSTYAELTGLYQAQGLSQEEIDQLLVLDVKPQSYFTEHGFRDQHAGGQAFAHDETVMGWLFGPHGGEIVSYTVDTPISDVINDPAFGDYGRLIFPVNTGYYSGSTLGNLSLTWYSNIDPDKTVEIANYMKSRAEAGETIFYDIYTDAEKAADPAKENTGLFFFKGTPGQRFAVCNSGGGFAYVASMHDSFPHALELSKKGYNAFALIYRPGAQTACEDLARAIAFIFDHAEELEVDTSCYSLWGGSAGARMAAWLGSYGTAGFGEASCPQARAVIMQYTGLSEVFGNEPPTYNCVGTRDGIANYRTMERRIQGIRANGTDAEIKVFDGLPHGFGLGTGTVAEGWLENAVSFWERQMPD